MQQLLDIQYTIDCCIIFTRLPCVSAFDHISRFAIILIHKKMHCIAITPFQTISKNCILKFLVSHVEMLVFTKCFSMLSSSFFYPSCPWFLMVFLLHFWPCLLLPPPSSPRRLSASLRLSSCACSLPPVLRCSSCQTSSVQILDWYCYDGQGRTTATTTTYWYLAVSTSGSSKKELHLAVGLWF